MPRAVVVTFRDSGGNRSLSDSRFARKGEVGLTMSVEPAKIAT